MNEVPGLSTVLRPIVEFELKRGNTIERIDRPAGTKCPLAVIFTKPLDFAGLKATSGIPAEVSTWQNRDRHYPLEAGYVCDRTRQAVAGPIN